MAHHHFEAHEALEGFRDLMYDKARQGELSTAAGQMYFWGAFQYVMWSRHAEGGDRNPENVRQWLAFLTDEGHDAITINRWLFGVREFYRWASHEGNYLDYDPATDVQDLPVSDSLEMP